MRRDEKRRAIVLYSGGLDSTYMVQYLIEQGYTSINLLFISRICIALGFSENSCKSIFGCILNIGFNIIFLFL